MEFITSSMVVVNKGLHLSCFSLGLFWIFCYFIIFIVQSLFQNKIRKKKYEKERLRIKYTISRAHTGNQWTTKCNKRKRRKATNTCIEGRTVWCKNCKWSPPHTHDCKYPPLSSWWLLTRIVRSTLPYGRPVWCVHSYSSVVSSFPFFSADLFLC